MEELRIFFAVFMLFRLRPGRILKKYQYNYAYRDYRREGEIVQIPVILNLPGTADKNKLIIFALLLREITLSFDRAGVAFSRKRRTTFR